MKNSGIYKIENKLNGKMYVGLTNNIDRRWGEHRKNLKQGKHINQHLQSSVNKYGIENFTFDIIEKCDLVELAKRELYWIDYYNTTDKRFGYNVDLLVKDFSNIKRRAKSNNRVYVKIYQIGENNEVVKIWESANAVAEFYNIDKKKMIKNLYGAKLESDRMRKRWKDFAWVSETKYDANFDYFEKMTWEPGTRFTVSRVLKGGYLVLNTLGEITHSFSTKSEVVNYFNTTDAAISVASSTEEIWRGVRIVREGNYDEAKDYSFTLPAPKYTEVLYKIQNTVTQEIVEISNISQTAKNLEINDLKLRMLLKGERKREGKVYKFEKYKEWIKIPL